MAGKVVLRLLDVVDEIIWRISKGNSLPSVAQKNKSFRNPYFSKVPRTQKVGLEYKVLGQTPSKIKLEEKIVCIYFLPFGRTPVSYLCSAPRGSKMWP